jgi:hypothetical protein
MRNEFSGEEPGTQTREGPQEWQGELLFYDGQFFVIDRSRTTIKVSR